MAGFSAKVGSRRSRPRSRGTTGRLAAMLVAAVPLLFLLGGCYAGIAGVVLGVLSASSGGGGSPADVPPVVRDIGISSSESPDRILVEFRIENEDEGRLGVKVDYVTLNDLSEPEGPAR